MAASENKYAGMWVFPSPEAMTRDVAAKMAATRRIFPLVMTATGVLFILGIIGFIARAVDDGFDNYAAWGYYAAIFSMIFMVAGGAPLAAVAFRLTKSHWRRPLSRISEMFAVLGIFSTLMLIPLLFVMPDINNAEFVVGSESMEIRRTIWFEVPIGAPIAWDILGLVFLTICGLGILWLSALPDLAECRLTATGFRAKIYGLLAGRWYGTKRQWNTQKAGLAILGGFYFMLLIFVQFVIVSDYAMSLVPGWKDSILPPLYTLTSLQSSLGAILIILFILRRWGGYGEYIGISPFWSASKIVLGLTLLWVYHTFAFFITFWFGRLEVEQNIIKYLFIESYGGAFVANLFFSFAVPFLILLWNPVRKSAWGPALAGLSALGGAFIFNIRMFVGSFNAADGQEIFNVGLARVPGPTYPDVFDVFMVIGGIGGAIFIYLLATKIVPILSVWEIKEGAKYQKMGTLIKGEYLILAKPE